MDCFLLVSRLRRANPLGHRATQPPGGDLPGAALRAERCAAEAEILAQEALAAAEEVAEISRSCQAPGEVGWGHSEL